MSCLPSGVQRWPLCESQLYGQDSRSRTCYHLWSCIRCGSLPVTSVNTLSCYSRLLRTLISPLINSWTASSRWSTVNKVFVASTFVRDSHQRTCLYACMCSRSWRLGTLWFLYWTVSCMFGRIRIFVAKRWVDNRKLGKFPFVPRSGDGIFSQDLEILRLITGVKRRASKELYPGGNW